MEPRGATGSPGTVVARALLDFHYRVVCCGGLGHEAEVLDPTAGLDSQASCLVER